MFHRRRRRGNLSVSSVVNGCVISLVYLSLFICLYYLTADWNWQVTTVDYQISYSYPFTLDAPVLEQDEIEFVSKEADYWNKEQLIYNLETFGPLTQNTNVIVIQTHTRINYVKHLIESLSKVRGIEDTLLIFSHDVHLPELYSQIKMIDFTRVMQIFYPYSIQLHPDNFPGGPEIHEDGVDWSPKASQIKLHWWWKLNFVFDQIKVLKNFSGIISFTEEDTYFTENALWTLNLMKTAMVENRCARCEILSMADDARLGIADLNYVKKWGYGGRQDFKNTVTTNWIPSLHLAFNRTVWNKIKRCSSFFCSYNDYSWDMTVSAMHVSPSCMRKTLTVLAPQWPRVFHTGSCGFHYGSDLPLCDPKALSSSSLDIATPYSSRFPKRLNYPVKKSYLIKDLVNKSSGGWKHPKIKELCISMVQNHPNISENS